MGILMDEYAKTSVIYLFLREEIDEGLLAGPCFSRFTAFIAGEIVNES